MSENVVRLETGRRYTSASTATTTISAPLVTNDSVLFGPDVSVETGPPQMSGPPTREEVEARLEAVEARMETRVTEIGGKIDRLTDLLQVRLGGVESSLNAVKADMSEVKADNKNTRWTIAITVVASLLAAGGALVTMQGNLLMAFQSALAVNAAHAPDAAPPAVPTRPHN